MEFSKNVNISLAYKQALILKALISNDQWVINYIQVSDIMFIRDNLSKLDSMLSMTILLLKSEIFDNNYDKGISESDMYLILLSIKHSIGVALDYYGNEMGYDNSLSAVRNRQMDFERYCTKDDIDTMVACINKWSLSNRWICTLVETIGKLNTQYNKIVDLVVKLNNLSIEPASYREQLETILDDMETLLTFTNFHDVYVELQMLGVEHQYELLKSGYERYENFYDYMNNLDIPIISISDLW